MMPTVARRVERPKYLPMEHPDAVKAHAEADLAVEQHRAAADAEQALEVAIRDTNLAPEVRDGFEADLPQARERRLRASKAKGDAMTKARAAEQAAREPWKA